MAEGISGVLMTYLDNLTASMTWLGQQERTIFLGQSVVYPGNAIFKTLSGVPDSKKIEMPVAEDMQMGLSTGLSLEGFIPVSIFPRMDFLLLAINQLVNHLDKIQDMSPFRPHVIIRTSIGATKPLYPGLQHCGDYTDAFRALVSNVKVVKLEKVEDILPAYQDAMNQSTILIEVADLYAT